MKQGKFFIMRFGQKLDDTIIDKINKETGVFENDDFDIIEDKLNFSLRNCKGEQRKELFEFVEVVIEDVKLLRGKLKKKIEKSNSEADDEINILLRNRLKEKNKFLKKWLKKRRDVRKDHIENTYNTRLFKSYESELLFDYLLKEMGTKDAIVSFIFRKLVDDYNISKETSVNEFKRVLIDDYNISVDKIKQLYQVETPDRLRLYDSLIKQFNRE